MLAVTLSGSIRKVGEVCGHVAEHDRQNKDTMEDPGFR